MFNASSVNKDADQFHGYHRADLHLCFHICKNLIFWCGGSYEDCLYQADTSEIILVVFLLIYQVIIHFENI